MSSRCAFAYTISSKRKVGIGAKRDAQTFHQSLRGLRYAQPTLQDSPYGCGWMNRTVIASFGLRGGFERSWKRMLSTSDRSGFTSCRIT